MYTLTQNKCLNYSHTHNYHHAIYDYFTTITSPLLQRPSPHLPQSHFNNPHIHPQSGTGHMACRANQSLA